MNRRTSRNDAKAIPILVAGLMILTCLFLWILNSQKIISKDAAIAILLVALVVYVIGFCIAAVRATYPGQK